MAVPHRREGREGREGVVAIQELLTSQRHSVSSRCPHCNRDSAERDHELVQAALRKRIRLLEMKLLDLEAKLAVTG